MYKINGKDHLYRSCYAFEPKCSFKGGTKEEFELWQVEALDEVKALLRFDRLKMCEYAVQKVESVELTSSSGTAYTRELYMLDTLEELQMPIYVLRPQDGCGKTALALHPHGSDGKNGLVGLIKNSEIKETEERFSYTYAFDMLEKGYTVFCPDILGAGDRRPISFDQPKKSDCTAINNALISIGLNLHGLTTFELTRAVDFIFEYGRENGLDTDDLICMGFSGGGLAAIWLAAVEKRIKRIYVSGYFHSLRKTLLQSNFCGCNFVPNMWRTIDMDSVALLCAPRMLYIETGLDDNLNGIDGLGTVKKMVEKVENVYKNIYGSDNFRFTVCEGKHKWYGAFTDVL